MMEEPPFPRHIHIQTDVMAPSNRGKLEELRALTKTNPLTSGKYESFVTDDQLHRFLVAKSLKGEFRVQISYNLLVEALKWRDLKQVDSLDTRIDEMEREGCTGKIYLPGYDRWERPILVFDNTAQNTSGMDGQLRYLAWSLDLAIRSMQEHVDKYVVFINLEHFSVFTCPSMPCSKETINMVQNMFPERMGKLAPHFYIKHEETSYVHALSRTLYLLQTSQIFFLIFQYSETFCRSKNSF